MDASTCSCCEAMAANMMLLVMMLLVMLLLLLSSPKTRLQSQKQPKLGCFLPVQRREGRGGRGGIWVRNSRWAPGMLGLGMEGGGSEAHGA